MADGTERTIDERDEQLELYVLGLLDDGETAAIERLLRDDPAARERARELRGVLSTLAIDIEPVEPPAGLKARILDAARDDAPPTSRPLAAATPPAPVSLAERRERGLSQWGPWAVAAVLALALAGSLIWNLMLQSDLDDRPETATYIVAGSGTAAGVTGELLVIEDTDAAILRLDNLQPLDAEHAYQVWLIADGDPVPNVTFVPGADGVATVAVPGEIDDYRTLAVTIEPRIGSLAPTTEPIIVSDLTEKT